MKRIKFMAMAIIVAVIIFLQNTMVYAELSVEGFGENNEDNIIITSEASKIIEELHDERRELVDEWDKNEARIKEIDNEIIELGAEELSNNEVYELLYTAGVDEESLRLINTEILPCVDLNPSNTIKWTSTREYYNCRGKLYELQIVRGVPNGDSETSELVKTYAGIQSSAKNFQAIAKNVIKVTATAIVSSTPKIGTAISIATTVYDILKEVISGLSTTTTIANAKAVYLIKLKSNFLYVFVKYAGSLDAGNQVLAYAGNSVSVDCSALLDVNLLSDTETVVRKDYASSQYYTSGYKEIAATNFWNYKENGSDFNCRYELTRIYVDMLGTVSSYRVPFPFSGF